MARIKLFPSFQGGGFPGFGVSVLIGELGKLSNIPNAIGPAQVDLLASNVVPRAVLEGAGLAVDQNATPPALISGKIDTVTFLQGPPGNQSVSGRFRIDLDATDLQAYRDGPQNIPTNEAFFELVMSGRDRIIGSVASETLEGGGGRDRLDARGGDDTLVGGGGADRLAGGKGNDTMTGGAGADVFIFDVARGRHADKVTDFESGTDTVELVLSAFSALGGGGALDPDMFITGRAAKQADDHLIYNDKNGKLFYDADGSGAGRKKLVATFTDFNDIPVPSLDAGDFLITV
jgi:Ca2+-binding RTX toxin-like protein